METEIKKNYHPNGKLWYEELYINGKRHGFQKIYYKNGQLRSDFFYKNNLTDGLFKNWNRDGTINYIKQCKNHVSHGPKISFIYPTKKQIIFKY